ncbi:Protein CHUP1, chloroplastic [Morella rubra]|uniref:Protein CHUP1, chloroplastic n=1 Tax=Morella rubra TaxID=262757 RepID=A0A6A1VLJ2_9ROSI|nr:Protein CHUP1, chloroplastic [Morella rubra]
METRRVPEYAHESDLQQQQIKEEEAEKLENSTEEEEETYMMKNTRQPNSDRSLAGKRNVTEIGLLQSLVKEVEQRKLTLERKLLELYGLKEQQSYIDQLRRQLEDKNEEIDMLKITADSEQVKRMTLREEIKQVFLAEKQLELAEKTLKSIQEKMDAKASHVMGWLKGLQEQVSRYQRQEISLIDTMVEKKLESVKDVELKVAEMKRRNRELELDRRELAIKLIVAKERIATLSSITEDKLLAKAKEDVSSLRHANEELQDQVERLKKNRFNMVEELVYQRWIHNCLRFEIQHHQNQSRKTSKCDSSKASSENFLKKIKPSSSDPGFDSISSSTSAESNETDSSTTSNSSSSSQRSSAKRLDVIPKIKRWGGSKDYSSAVSSNLQAGSSPEDSMSRTGLIRRFSMSMVPSNQPMLRGKGDSAVTTLSKKAEVQEFTKSVKTPNFLRARRVSFNDSVESVESPYLSIQKSVQGVLDEKEMIPIRSDHTSTVDLSHICCTENVGEKLEPSSATLGTLREHDHSNGTTGKLIKSDSISIHEGSRTEIDQGDELHSRMPEELRNDNRVRPSQPRKCSE